MDEPFLFEVRKVPLVGCQHSIHIDLDRDLFGDLLLGLE